jgi:hypothetical protein
MQSKELWYDIYFRLSFFSRASFDSLMPQAHQASAEQGSSLSPEQAKPLPSPGPLSQFPLPELLPTHGSHSQFTLWFSG